MKPTEIKRYVLDSSAVIALLNEEPGMDVVEKLLPDALMSSVNLSEVIVIAQRYGIAAHEINSALSTFLPDIISFDEKLAYIAAELDVQSKKFGLSLGDRACLALGISENVPVVTADKIWKNITVGCDVIVIR